MLKPWIFDDLDFPVKYTSCKCSTMEGPGLQRQMRGEQQFFRVSSYQKHYQMHRAVNRVRYNAGRQLNLGPTIKTRLLPALFCLLLNWLCCDSHWLCAGAKTRDWVWDLDWDTSSARFKRRSSVPASSQRKCRWGAIVGRSEKNIKNPFGGGNLV